MEDSYLAWIKYFNPFLAPLISFKQYYNQTFDPLTKPFGGLGFCFRRCVYRMRRKQHKILHNVISEGVYSVLKFRFQILGCNYNITIIIVSLTCLCCKLTFNPNRIVPSIREQCLFLGCRCSIFSTAWNRTIVLSILICSLWFYIHLFH